MYTNYLIISILLGIFLRESTGLGDLHHSTIDVAILEAMRLGKSQLIRAYMNESVDPCEDFYQFACGNWRTHHPATITKVQTWGFNFVVEEFDRLIVRLLNQPIGKYTTYELNVKHFYDSCLNYAIFSSHFDYKESMKKLIKEFGRMPALEGNKWQEKNFDWIEIIGKISYKYGLEIIYGYSTVAHPFDPDTKLLLMKSHLLLEFSDTSANAVNGKVALVEQNLKQLLGLRSITAKKTAKEIVDFSYKLWKATANVTGDESEETTFEQMHEKYSHHLDVKKLVKSLFGYVPDGPVLESNPSYIKGLGTLMKKTPKRVVANYIFYVLVGKFPYLQGINKLNAGATCLELSKNYFLPILYHMSYRMSANAHEVEQEFHKMWQGITTTLQNTLDSNELGWFDDESREAALEKLHLMKLYIGSFEDMNFEEQYKGLTLTGSNLGNDIKSIMSFNAKQTREKLNKLEYAKHFKIDPLTPSNMLAANVVRFPVTLVITDFMWSKYVPIAFNYGRLGSLLAHEIVHGFSGHGRKYNRLGVFIDWIYKDIEQGYDERRQCYYDQYHNYTLDNKPLPQDEVQAENVADNGGIYLAYHTYLKWLADENRTQHELDMETLPHLNYTNKQLFFIGYSQTWCADTLSLIRYKAAIVDSHSPPEFRGFVPLLNFEEFSKEFNCPSGSRMNPRKKCSIY